MKLTDKDWKEIWKGLLQTYPDSIFGVLSKREIKRFEESVKIALARKGKK